jgi:metal-sulfur cluster biosynthetic enzyme
MMHDENLQSGESASHDSPLVDAIWNSLTTVIDPEIGLDIISLGLVYDVAANGPIAVITHTLTTPVCPMEKIITDVIRSAVQLVDGIGKAETVLVWVPAQFIRVHGWTAGETGLRYGFVLLLFGGAGTVLGGMLSAHFGKRGVAQPAIWITVVGMAVAGPLLAAAGLANDGWSSLTW